MGRLLRDALGWLLLPLIPMTLAMAYRDVLSFGASFGGPDPADWDWQQWLVFTGPLLGFGFLAGATIDLPDDPGLRGWRWCLSRRALWVMFGPWVGLFAWLALLYGLAAAQRAFPQSTDSWWARQTQSTQDVLGLTYWLLTFALVSYGWLVPAIAALRRARRRGGLRTSFKRGLAVMFAFTGSLFGTFWAITQVFRKYFFDRTIVPLLIALATTMTLSGCASTITYGEVRRRELFQALLVSWVFGLAIVWRSWSRRHRKP